MNILTRQLLARFKPELDLIRLLIKLRRMLNPGGHVIPVADAVTFRPTFDEQLELTADDDAVVVRFVGMGWDSGSGGV
nr:hypothetical protein [Marinobacter sp. R17]